MPRLRKDADDLLSVTLNVRFRRDEVIAVERQAAALNQTISNYIRAALAGHVIVRPVEGLTGVHRHKLFRAILAIQSGDADGAVAAIQAVLK